MESNIFTLIIGASISLVVSIITIIVTSIFQLIRDNKTRKWQVEDNKRNIKIEILKNRIHNVEIFLNELSECAKTIFLSEETLLADFDIQDPNSIRYEEQINALLNSKKPNEKRLDQAILDQVIKDAGPEEIEELEQYFKNKRETLKNLKREPVDINIIAGLYEKLIAIDIIKDYNVSIKYDIKKKRIRIHRLHCWRNYSFSKVV